jgi:hypothetical protein
MSRIFDTQAAAPAASGLKPVVLVLERFPKKGENPEDCQDAYAEDAARGCFAVADGAATSFMPRAWAEILVNQFCAAPTDQQRSLVTTGAAWRTWLEDRIGEWRRAVVGTIGIAGQTQQLRLRNRLNRQEPAAATFAGVLVQPPTWRAVTVGDSCLFHVRGEKLRLSTPLSRSREFGGHPECLMTSRREPLDGRWFSEGTVQEGDLLILATDAFSKWILAQHEAGEEAWRSALRWLRTQTTWTSMYARLEQLRSHKGEGALDDDDVALVVISMETGDRPSRTTSPVGFEHEFPGQGGDDGRSRRRDPLPPPQPERPRQPLPDPRPEQPGARWRRPRVSLDLLALLMVLTLMIASASLGLTLVTARKVDRLATNSLRGSIPRNPNQDSIGKLLADAQSEGRKPEPTGSARNATVTLVPQSVIRESADSGAAVVFGVSQRVVVSGPATDGWVRVQLPVWVAERAGTVEIARTAGNRLEIVRMGATARSAPRIDPSTVFGNFFPQGPLPLEGELPDPVYGRWFRTRIEGYVRQP